MSDGEERVFHYPITNPIPKEYVVVGQTWEWLVGFMNGMWRECIGEHQKVDYERVDTPVECKQDAQNTVLPLHFSQDEFIGISEDRLHHSIGVARKCYELAKARGESEEFCRKMFTIGWNHDVGYEFSKSKEEHPRVSEELLELIGVNQRCRESAKTLHAIKKHGDDTRTASKEWLILNEADMTVDSKGNSVTVEARLADITARFGVQSDEFKKAQELCKRLKLI